MSDERFVVGSNEIGEIIVTDVETDRVYRYGDISKFFGLIRLLNEQQDQISYWKHKVNGLLWILGQFDEEKVKELLKEVEDDNKMFMQ